MEEFKTFIGVMLLLSGLMIYFAATDPYIGKTELAKEKTVFEYRFSKYDPIIHKIFVNIKAEDSRSTEGPNIKCDQRGSAYMKRFQL